MIPEDRFDGRLIGTIRHLENSANAGLGGCWKGGYNLPVTPGRRLTAHRKGEELYLRERSGAAEGS